MIFKVPLSELTDSQLLDVLDEVSNEVKRRNSLSPDTNEVDFKKAVNHVSEVIQRAMSNR